MDLERRVALVKEVGEEIVTEDELRALLAQKPHPIAYDGFEPSGTIHIAQGLLRAINVNKMTAAGIRFKMFVADWHAWANNKMGGDLDKIQTTGRYIQEIWKTTGMDLANVEFVWASEFVDDPEYWKKVMNIARDSSLDRVLRTTQIMGRSEKDKLSAAQILYPCMQAADIFHLKADITQLGMDQRKVNMLAREVGPKLGFWKPVVVSHHMMMGLQQPPVEFDAGAALRRVMKPLETLSAGMVAASSEAHVDEGLLNFLAVLGETSSARSWRDIEQAVSEIVKRLRTYKSQREADPRPFREASSLEEAIIAVEEKLVDEERDYDKWFVARQTAMKMSKSNPDSAIFMNDSAQQVEAKLKKAYCPEKVVAENPVLEYMRYIVFERAPKGEVTVERPEKFGGTVTFHSYAELEAAYAEGKLHPMDLKKTCARSINDFLQPVRDHFEKDEKARALKEQVESFKVTR